MILIGERINGGFKDIKEAIANRDPKVIRSWAKIQADAGATYIDVNMGAASSEAADLVWMIEQVESEVSVPVSIDNNKPDILKEAVRHCKLPPLINSTVAVESKLDAIMPVAAEYNASIIGLVMDETGSPKSAEKRVENAGLIFEKAMQYGIPPERLFIDPIVMPLKFMQDQARVVLDAVSQFVLFSDPPPHIVCGLSNVSNGARKKKLINRVFLAMLVSRGLDAVICDVTDTDLMDTFAAAEIFMNKSIYADSFTDIAGKK
jgi:5-methyltetrahydrofolate corrinoid/iron sulfur protein methyltransferase